MCLDITNKYITNNLNQIAIPLTNWSSYTWKISDPLTLNEMKSAKNEDEWKSDVFSAEGFRWYLCVCPNGNSPANAGYVSFYLNLALLPPKIKQIHVRFELILSETETKAVPDIAFNVDSMDWGLHRYTLRNGTIQKSDELTFCVNIQLYGIIDKDDNDITSKYTNMREIEMKEDRQIDVAIIDEISTNSPLIQHRSLESRLESLEKMMTDFVSMKQQINDNFDKILINLQRIEQKINNIELTKK